MFYHPLKELMSLLFKSELYSHIILIPIVSGYFIYLKRRIIFSDLKYSFRSGITVITIGMILYFMGIEQRLFSPHDFFCHYPSHWRSRAFLWY
jgi:hypothetical protein